VSWSPKRQRPRQPRRGSKSHGGSGQGLSAKARGRNKRKQVSYRGTWENSRSFKQLKKHESVKSDDSDKYLAKYFYELNLKVI
jgi:hypothetical protein